MRHSVVAALGAALIVALGASSAAQASIVDFGVTAFGNSITYNGTSLDQSISLDLDQALLLVTGVNPGDFSGLALFDRSQSCHRSPADGQRHPLWRYDACAPGGPAARGRRHPVLDSWGRAKQGYVHRNADYGAVDQSGDNRRNRPATVGNAQRHRRRLLDTPVLLALTANQAGGPGETTSASFTNTSSFAPSVPEASTWAMMGLGFAALGYVGSRRRKANLAMLSA